MTDYKLFPSITVFPTPQQSIWISNALSRRSKCQPGI